MQLALEDYKVPVDEGCASLLAKAAQMFTRIGPGCAVPGPTEFDALVWPYRENMMEMGLGWPDPMAGFESTLRPFEFSGFFGSPRRDHVFTCRGNVFTRRDHVFTGRGNVFTGRDHVFTGRGNVFTRRGNVFTARDHVFTRRGKVFTSRLLRLLRSLAAAALRDRDSVTRWG